MINSNLMIILTFDFVILFFFSINIPLNMILQKCLIGWSDFRFLRNLITMWSKKLHTFITTNFCSTPIVQQ
jgi:hypothetical protein